MKAGTDPERLVASEAAPESLRTALRSAKSDLPGDAQLRALAASLAPQLGAGGAGGAGGGGAAPAKAGMRGLHWMIGSGVIVGGIALVVAIRAHRAPVDAHVQQPLAQPTAVATLPQVPVTPPAAELAATDESAADEQPTREAEPESAAQERRARVGAGPTPRAAEPGATVGKPEPAPKPSEASLLDGARKALRSDPRQALALTDKHRVLYPSGLLAQEREVIAIEALRKLGEQDEARRRREQFDSRYPTTIHGREIESERGAEKK